MALQVGELFAKITGDDSPINRTVDGVEKRFNGLAGQLTNTGKVLEGAGKAITTKIGLPIAAFATLSAKTFINFNDGMREVQALSGATGEEFELLTETAKDLGANTKFSASEAAEGMKFLALAGFETGQIVDAMPGILDLAAASGENLALVSDIVSDGLSAFGLEAKDASKFADVLAKASSSSNTSVAQLGESFKFAAPVAASFGSSVEETAAVIGIMANSGIKASQAGTTLRSAFLRLSDPPKEAKEALEDLNIQTANAQGEMLPLSNIVGQLGDKFSGLTEQQKLQAASSIFGTTAVSGMLKVIEAGEGGILEFQKALENSEGTAAEMAEVMEGGLGGAVRTLGSTFEAVRIEVGERLEPVLVRIVELAKSLLRGFLNLDDGVKNVIFTVGGLAALLGPLLLIIGKIVTTLGSMAPAATGAAASVGPLKGLFAALTGPVGLVIIAIGALTATFIKLMQDNEEFRETMLGIWRSIQASLSGIFSAIKEVAMIIFNDLRLFWKNWGETITNLFISVFEALGNIIDASLKVITGIFHLFVSIFTEDWETAWNSILLIATGILDALKNVFKIALDLILALFKTNTADVWEATKKGYTNVKESAAKIMKSMGETISNLLDSIKESFVSAFKSIRESVSNIINSVKETISSVMDTISQTISNILSAIEESFINAWTAILEYIETVFGLITDLFNLVWSGIVTYIENVLGLMLKMFETSWNTIFKIVETALTLLEDITGIKFTEILDLAERLKDAFIDVFNRIKSNVLRIWNGLVSAIVNKINRLVKSISGLFSKIAGFSKGVGKIVEDTVNVRNPSPTDRGGGGNSPSPSSTRDRMGVDSNGGTRNTYNTNVTINTRSPRETFNEIKNLDTDLRVIP